MKWYFNPLPTDKILGWTKLKAFADDNSNVIQMAQYFHDRVEKIVGKGESAGYQHFSPFPTMFSKGVHAKVVKSRDCVVKT